MQMRIRKTVVMPLVASLSLTACATGNEGIGQTIGALVLGGACLAVARGDTRAACIAAAAAGFVLGGAIGQQIDARDRKRREAALAAALNDEQMWRERYGNGPMAQKTINQIPMDKSAPKQDLKTAHIATWHNPDTDDSGRIEPLRAYVNNTNQQCRQVRESYFKNGEPISALEVWCKNAQGRWAPV